MSQIVTPPSIGIQEASSKNWYRAEGLRKIYGDLLSIYGDVEDEPARRELKNALDSIAEARCVLDPRLRPMPQRKAKPRGQQSHNAR